MIQAVRLCRVMIDLNGEANSEASCPEPVGETPSTGKEI